MADKQSLSGTPDTSSTGMSRLTRRNLTAVRRIEKQLLSERSPGDVVIDAITAFCGSKVFIWIHLVWYGGWILANTLGPEGMRFDPYPFDFLTLTVSLEAIFLSTFILITQNRQARMADLRANLDLQINLLGEEENTKMLAMLQAIHEHLGIEGDHDAELDEMRCQLKPEALALQIEQLMESPGDVGGSGKQDPADSN